VQQDLVGLAFAAGLVAALNPCGFAMLPAYLALVVRGGAAYPESESHIGDVAISVGRAVAATAAMTLGFLGVFGGFGLLTVSLASSVQRYLPYVTVGIGILLVAVGVWLLAGRTLALPVPNRLAHRPSWAPTSKAGSMFGYGVGYAIASLSCTIGPFLAVTGAGVSGSSALGRLWIYVAYAAGFALVVGALAVGVALAGSTLVDRMRRIVPYINRIGGAVLILVGMYVAYYGYYEIRLFTAAADPADPVIAAAGRLQAAIAGWVHRHGAWPWTLLLTSLVVAALLWAWREKRGATSRWSHADRARADDAP
jgi:cytochrome c biogenesis protein CcdA